jgi:hypothetical protein
MNRELGFPPGEFIKPDPSLTRRETRELVLAELEHLFSGKLCGLAAQLATNPPIGLDLEAEIRGGEWPVGRLYAVERALASSPLAFHLPVDLDERFRWVGTWSQVVCEDHLCDQGDDDLGDAAKIAVGFVTTDKLPGGRVIESFWNHSPFEALREAPPLSEPLPPSVDDQIEGFQQGLVELLMDTYTVKLSGWEILAVASVFFAYMLSAVAMCASHC